MSTYSCFAVATLLLLGQYSMKAQAISKIKAEFMQTVAKSSAGRRKSTQSRTLGLESFQADLYGSSKLSSALRNRVIEKSKHIPPSNKERVLQNYGNSNNNSGNNNAYSKNYNGYNAGGNRLVHFCHVAHLSRCLNLIYAVVKNSSFQKWEIKFLNLNTYQGKETARM